MHGLFNKLSGALNFRHTLDFIAVDTNFLSIIYIIMYNTGNKIVVCQLQNAISNFPKFCEV